MRYTLLSDWLIWLESLHPKSVDLGLERVLHVADQLALREFSCPVIVVAGSNGKGSNIAILESIYQQHGYHTACYTSPHILKFNERIHVNQEEVDDDTLCAAFDVIDKARGDISLSLFELSTLASLWIFKQKDLDVILLEIGLGGRLDTVNVVDSDVAIVTNISLEHCEWLGDNRESIGFEKAGVFRKGKVAICGDSEPPLSIINHANEINSKLRLINEHFRYEVLGNNWSWNSEKNNYSNLPMPTLYIENAATALMAVESLQSKLPVSENDIAEGLSKASVKARFEIIQNEKGAIILDVAHNPAAAKLLAKQLKQYPCEGKRIAYFSMLKDKDINATIEELKDIIDEWHYFELNTPRGVSLEQLDKAFKHLKIKNEQITINPNDQLIVFGSFYTVAEFLNNGLEDLKV